MRYAHSVLIIGLAFAVTVCDKIRSSPQLIEADGKNCVACKGLVWISDEGSWLGGQTTFKVTFTDAQGFEHIVKGIKKSSAIGGLKMHVPVPVSDLPDTSTAMDSSGKPYRDGDLYSWAD
jgi:hypothetical protein